MVGAEVVPASGEDQLVAASSADGGQSWPSVVFLGSHFLLSKKTAGRPAELMITSERSARSSPPVPVNPRGATSPALGFVLIAALKRLARLGLAISSQSFGIRPPG